MYNDHIGQRSFDGLVVMNWIILLCMIGAALSVIVGVIAMAVNGKFNKQNSNRLMRLRVLFQSAALAVIVIAIWMTS